MTTPATAREIAQQIASYGCNDFHEALSSCWTNDGTGLWCKWCLRIQALYDAAVRAAFSIVDGTLASAIEAERDPHTCNVLEGLRLAFAFSVARKLRDIREGRS